MTLPEQKEVYTPQDFAQWLGIGADSVKHHLRARRHLYPRTGGRWRFDAKDAEKILSYLLTVCQNRAQINFDHHKSQLDIMQKK